MSSPASQRLAFLATVVGASMQLITVPRADRHAQVVATAPQEHLVYLLSFSGDSRYLAYLEHPPQGRVSNVTVLAAVC